MASRATCRRDDSRFNSLSRSTHRRERPKTTIQSIVQIVNHWWRLSKSLSRHSIRGHYRLRTGSRLCMEVLIIASPSLTPRLINYSNSLQCNRNSRLSNMSKSWKEHHPRQHSRSLMHLVSLFVSFHRLRIMSLGTSSTHLCKLKRQVISRRSMRRE